MTITEKLGLHNKITQKHSEEIEEIIQQKLQEIVQQERKRILKEIKEFSFAKTWEIDKNKLYIDATPEAVRINTLYEIIKIIKK